MWDGTFAGTWYFAGRMLSLPSPNLNKQSQQRVDFWKCWCGSLRGNQKWDFSQWFRQEVDCTSTKYPSLLIFNCKQIHQDISESLRQLPSYCNRDKFFLEYQRVCPCRYQIAGTQNFLPYCVKKKGVLCCTMQAFLNRVRTTLTSGPHSGK